MTIQFEQTNVRDRCLQTENMKTDRSRWLQGEYAFKLSYAIPFHVQDSNMCFVAGKALVFVIANLL